MPRRHFDPHAARDAASPRRRRKATLPRVRRLLATGLCAGAALWSATASAQAEPRTTSAVQPASFPRFRCQNGVCTPCNPPQATEFAPYYPPGYSPYYPPGVPAHGGELTPPRPPVDQSRPGQPGQTEASPGDAPTSPQTQTAPDMLTQPGNFGAADMTASMAPPAPSFSSATGATGTPSAPSSAAPNMIGDFFGVGRQATVQTRGIAFDSSFGYSATGAASVISPTESTVGRIKQAENYSPIPANRIFLDYAAYQNVPIGTRGGLPADVDVERFTVGLERTFLDGMMSFEIRMPLAVTLDSGVNVNGSSDVNHLEAGNLNVALKALLYENENVILATGLGARSPTANDLTFSGGTTTIEVENQSLHLLPYLGLLLTPGDTFFGQAVVQVDVDVNGNGVFQTTGNLPRTFQGDLRDQTFLFTSFTVGAWLYDDPCADRLTSAAGTIELHHSTTVSDPDTINTETLAITQNQDDFNSSTIIAGLHLFYAGGAQVTFGYGVPVGDDRFADGEFRTLLTRHY